MARKTLTTEEEPWRRRSMLSCVASVTDSGLARVGKAKDAFRVNVVNSKANSVTLWWSTNGQGVDDKVAVKRRPGRLRKRDDTPTRRTRGGKPVERQTTASAASTAEYDRRTGHQ
jgi:hypothetical protein